MIHEATLAAGMEEDAAKKKHTSTKEAMELIDVVKPWRTVLTHFSCRYMKIAEVLPEHTEKKVMIAFDHLRLSLSNFEWAYQFVDIFGQVLSNEKEKVETPEDLNEKEKPIKK